MIDLITMMILVNISMPMTTIELTDNCNRYIGYAHWTNWEGINRIELCSQLNTTEAVVVLEHEWGHVRFWRLTYEDKLKYANMVWKERPYYAPWQIQEKYAWEQVKHPYTMEIFKYLES